MLVDSVWHRMEEDQLVPVMTALEPTYLCIDEAVSCDCKGGCENKKCNCARRLATSAFFCAIKTKV